MSFWKRKKRVDIGKPKKQYCAHCGRKKLSTRHSWYDEGTGDEVRAHYSYVCANFECCAHGLHSFPVKDLPIDG